MPMAHQYLKPTTSKESYEADRPFIRHGVCLADQQPLLHFLHHRCWPASARASHTYKQNPRLQCETKDVRYGRAQYEKPAVITHSLPSPLYKPNGAHPKESRTNSARHNRVLRKGGACSYITDPVAGSSCTSAIRPSTRSGVSSGVLKSTVISNFTSATYRSSETVSSAGWELSSTSAKTRKRDNKRDYSFGTVTLDLRERQRCEAALNFWSF